MDLPFWMNYLMIISCSGGIILLIFSIMAFCNVENFEIKTNKNIKAGLIVFIGCIFYFALAIFLYWKISKDNSNKPKKFFEDRLMETIEERRKNMNNINNPSIDSKSDEEEDKSSEENFLMEEK